MDGWMDEWMNDFSSEGSPFLAFALWGVLSFVWTLILSLFFFFFFFPLVALLSVFPLFIYLFIYIACHLQPR